ncbi:YdcF family protein [Shimazuella kribbensis]|uniref:YdcF family protein n=1 Tax=Shimazuella kribbensis TaxID=139808 RepID=UPI00041B8C26|nr:YdcF family protein [Shimazuella kribbensis]
MIPKCPDVPRLTPDQIKALTEVVFLKTDQLGKEHETCDLLFVFGGTHPGSWETTFQLYQNGLASHILLTGGIKPGAILHPTWKDKNRRESHVMKEKLLDLGVPEKAITLEDRSTDSLENILFAKDVYDFSKVNKLAFICKSYAAGRQLRTLQKQLPSSISFLSYPFDTSIWENQVISRSNWMNEQDSRSYVYGEYLRILHYGTKGDIVPLDKNISGL